ASARIMTEQGRAIAQLLEAKPQEETDEVLPRVTRLAENPLVLAALMTATGIILATAFWTLRRPSNPSGRSAIDVTTPANTSNETSPKPVDDVPAPSDEMSGERIAVSTAGTSP